MPVDEGLAGDLLDDLRRPRPPLATGLLVGLLVCAVWGIHLAGLGQVSEPVPSPRLSIDPDSAPLPLMATLPHVGRSLLEAFRIAREDGGIRTEEDLDRIPGIGPKTLEDLRPYLTFATLSDPAIERENHGRSLGGQ